MATIGIDLGTTNSCAAYMKDGKVKIIPIEIDSNVTSSWVTFTDDGEVQVGQKAKDNAHLYIKNSVYEFKRLMGLKYDSPKLESTIKSVPYRIVNSNGYPAVEINRQGKVRRYSPEELSSFVLAYVKDKCEKHMNERVTRVVVTVPAYFNDFQRQATKTAAIMAGFETVNIINEPTAAALAYSHFNVLDYQRNVLVYDFGGGTFDVSIVTVGEAGCIVKATKGDSHLGGTDIDSNLIEYVKKDFLYQHNAEIKLTEVEIRRLKNKCETVKKNLSGERNSTEIELSNLSGKEYFSVITQTEFDMINKDIFEKTLEISKICLEKANMQPNQIAEVVLVGGSTRNLKTQELLKEYFGKSRIKHRVNPDEAVAYGAAVHASNLLGNKLEITDVISLSLGIELLDQSFSVLIRCNTTIPNKETRRFCTISKDTSIYVYQGESTTARENCQLGSFVLNNTNYSKIEVLFEIDAEGMLTVTAVSCVDEQNKSSIEINLSNLGLTSDQILKQTEEIRQYRANEIRQKEFYENKRDLREICDVITNKVMRENGDVGIIDKCIDVTRWLEKVTLADKEEVDTKKETMLQYILEDN